MIQPKVRTRGKRPIDRMRDAAGSAKLPAGCGNIVAMKPINDRMYFLAEHCVSSAVMADHIDPDRTNPAIPLFVQKVELHYGIDQHFIRKTIGVAFELIDPIYLPDGFDKDAVLTLAFETSVALAFVMDVCQELHDQQAEIRAQGQARQLSANYIPRTPNLNGKVRQSLAALRDVEVAVKRIVGQFYPKEIQTDPWDKALRPALLAKYGKADGFQDWLEAVWQLLKGVADHRHAMIHPGDLKSVEISDYELRMDGAFVAPTIEIIHPDSPVERRDVIQFLAEQVAHVAEAFEALLGYLCDLNVRNLGEKFRSGVAMFPEGEPRNGSHLTWSTELLGEFAGRMEKSDPSH